MIACEQTTQPSPSPAPRARRWVATSTALAGCLLLGASCKAPKILCTTAHTGAGTPFAVRYTPVPGTVDCAMLKGGFVGIESYDRGGPEQAPGFKKQPVAIRPAEVGDLVGSYGVDIPTKMLSSNGEFVDERPGADGFCHVGAMTPVALDLPAVPAMTDPMTMKTTPALPATKVSYEWSNVAFYVSPRLIGTQFTADLKYTKDACTAMYKVVGLYPGVACEAMTMGCDGMPVGTGKPDEEACSPCANPAAGRATGSGISPDVDVACDPVLLRCLPPANSAPPALRPQPTVCPATTPAPTTTGDAAASDATATPAGPMCLDAAPGGEDGGGAGDGAAGGEAGPSGDGSLIGDVPGIGDVLPGIGDTASGN